MRLLRLLLATRALALATAVHSAGNFQIASLDVSFGTCSPLFACSREEWGIFFPEHIFWGGDRSAVIDEEHCDIRLTTSQIFGRNRLCKGLSSRASNRIAQPLIAILSNGGVFLLERLGPSPEKSFSRNMGISKFPDDDKAVYQDLGQVNRFLLPSFPAVVSVFYSQ